MADPEWRPAEEARAVAENVMLKQHSRLHELYKAGELRIIFIFRDKPQVLRGKQCAATVQIVKGLNAYLAAINVPKTSFEFESDGVTPRKRRDKGHFFVVQIYEPDWKNCAPNQKRAQMHHECCHMGFEYDEEGFLKLSIVPHDFEAFFSEIDHYGLWNDILERLGESVTPYIDQAKDKIDAEEAQLRRMIEGGGGE